MAFSKQFTGLVATLCVALAHAQPAPAWRHSPDIVVIGAAEDPRRALVDQAIVYWNHQLEQANSGFRLQAARHVVQPLPEPSLLALFQRAVSAGLHAGAFPAEITALPGDIVIVLTHSNVISFAAPMGTRVLVLLRSAELPPMRLPNVARNVAAHEIGHAIGLGHNNDPKALMCGRPASCRPVDFAMPEERLFPLLATDRDQLSRLYPPDWTAEK